MINRKKELICAAVVGAACSQQALAVENVKIGGFVRAAVTATDKLYGEDYMERVNQRGDYGDSHFGLTASAQIDKHWSAAGQLWAAGREDNFNMVLDWGYATYRVNDMFSVSAGRIKYPNLLVSEYIDVGITYPWFRPPEEVYNFDVRGPSISFEAFNGVRGTFQNFVGNFEYSVDLFGGGAKTEDAQFDQMLGARIRGGNDIVTLQAGYTRSRIEDATIAGWERPADMSGKRQSVVSFGANVDWNNIVAYAEHVVGDVDDLDLTEEENQVKTTASYVTLGYRIGKFLPHVTSAQFEHENKLGQDSIAVGLAYTFNPSTTLKVEWKKIDPTERVDTDPTENPAGFWEEFENSDTEEAKTYSIALDIVF